MSEAVVVGAGPVGLTAAIELARRGIGVRVVDAGEGPVAESRAVAINPRTLELLGPSGAAERLLEAGRPLRRLNVYVAGRRRFSLELRHFGEPWDFMLMLPQAQTERILVDVLAEAGLGVGWGERIEDLDGPEEPLVVGADGARSTVRGLAGIGFEGRTDEREWGLADVRVEGLAPDESHAIRFTGGVLALFPVGEGWFRLVASQAPAIEVLPDWAAASEVGWESTFRISSRLATTYSSADGRIHLAGDAAHLHSPLGGRGMNLGIEDACWLAYLAAEGRLGEYTAARKPAGRAVVRETDALTRFMTRSGAAGTALLRWLVPAALAIEPIHRRSVHRFSGRDSDAPPWL